MVSNLNLTGSGVKSSVSNESLYSKVLRKVTEREGFHFYLGIGQPTGETAVSLADFLEKLENVNVQSVNFHYPRKDFEKWVLEVIGDTELASKLSMISRMHTGIKGEALRNQILRIVKVRLSEIKPQPPATSKPPVFVATSGTGKPKYLF